MKLEEESLFIPLQKNESLHLKRFFTDPKGPTVFALHGAIENGKIFYSKNQKGLGPFLAKSGFDVFIADLRGRGESFPQISKKSKYGQYHSITQELPLFFDKIFTLKMEHKIHLLAHSWGGVLLMSYLARYPDFFQKIKSAVFFGTKRRILSQNFEKFWKIDLFWNLISSLLIKWKGFLPAKEFGLGSDNESAESWKDSKLWIKGPWIDTCDSFDYASAITEHKIFPLLNLVGSNDFCLGNPRDVKLFLDECKMKVNIDIIGKRNGYHHDYGHIDILTHSDSEKEIYPLVLNWFKKYDQ